MLILRLLIRCCFCIFQYYLFQLNHFFVFSSQAPDENEMLEFMQNPTSEGNDITNQFESTIADDTITEQHQQVK